jgi:hypothetical protein
VVVNPYYLVLAMEAIVRFSPGAFEWVQRKITAKECWTAVLETVKILVEEIAKRNAEKALPPPAYSA